MLIPPVIVGIILELTLYIAFQGWQVLCGDPQHALGDAGSPSYGPSLPVEYPCLWSVPRDEGGMLPSQPSPFPAVSSEEMGLESKQTSLKPSGIKEG